MASSSRRSAASGASLLSGIVGWVGSPMTEATAPYAAGSGAAITGIPVGAGYAADPLGGG